jgi:hypothetical protein
MLSFASGSAIKRIKAGVKARRDRALRKLRSAGRAFTLPTKSASNEKRIHLFNRLRTVSHNFGRFKTTSRPESAGWQEPHIVPNPSQSLALRQINPRVRHYATDWTTF